MDAISAAGLRAQGPIEILDHALSLVRRAPPSQLVRAWLSALPLTAAVFALYELERVEGVHGTRPLFALLLVLGFAYRAVMLGSVARAFVLELRPALPMPEGAGTLTSVVSTAAVAAVGLWVWLWPLGGAAKLSPFAALAFLPFLSARGAVAPSWLARASCAAERGLVAVGRAVDDNANVRGVMASVELMLLFGALAMFANLYALTGLALMVASSMLGLETAFVSAFLSPDNEVVPLALAAATLVLFEPLRAAVSAYAFTDARSRRDGADLHAAVDQLIAAASPPSARVSVAPRKPGLGSAALVVLWFGCVPLAHADAPQDHDAHDKAVRAKVAQILQQHEFDELAKTDTKSFWKWLSDYLEHLFDTPDEDKDKPLATDSWHIDLPQVSPWAVMLVAILVLSLVVLRGSREWRKEQRAPRRAHDDGRLKPSEQAPRELLDNAAALAEKGLFREALRALYVATLAALDRARLIRFEPAKTNGQYLRAMPPSEMRQLFGAFTHVFDHKWYGREPADRDDYERCRVLADRICAWQELS